MTSQDEVKQRSQRHTHYHYASDDVSLLTNGDGVRRPAVSTRDNCNQILATILKTVKENNELSKEIREELKVMWVADRDARIG